MNKICKNRIRQFFHRRSLAEKYLRSNRGEWSKVNWKMRKNSFSFFFFDCLSWNPPESLLKWISWLLLKQSSFLWYFLKLILYSGNCSLMDNIEKTKWHKINVWNHPTDYLNASSPEVAKFSSCHRFSLVSTQSIKWCTFGKLHIILEAFASVYWIISVIYLVPQSAF